MPWCGVTDSVGASGFLPLACDRDGARKSLPHQELLSSLTIMVDDLECHPNQDLPLVVRHAVNHCHNSLVTIGFHRTFGTTGFVGAGSNRSTGRAWAAQSAWPHQAAKMAEGSFGARRIWA